MDDWTDWIPDCERIKRMQDDIDEMKRERSIMVDALIPFAKNAVSWSGYDESTRLVDSFPGMRAAMTDLRVSDLNAARSAIAGYI